MGAVNQRVGPDASAVLPPVAVLRQAGLQVGQRDEAAANGRDAGEGAAAVLSSSFRNDAAVTADGGCTGGYVAGNCYAGATQPVPPPTVHAGTVTQRKARNALER